MGAPRKEKREGTRLLVESKVHTVASWRRKFTLLQADLLLSCPHNIYNCFLQQGRGMQGVSGASPYILPNRAGLLTQSSLSPISHSSHNTQLVCFSKKKDHAL